MKIRDGAVFVCCRDQIVKLRDLNGDGETVFSECFNSDHVKVWGLKRTQNYGSKHIDEGPLEVTKGTVSAGGRAVCLEIADLAPTRGLEIKYRVKGTDGRPVTGAVHNTIHAAGK